MEARGYGSAVLAHLKVWLGLALCLLWHWGTGSIPQFLKGNSPPTPAWEG